MSLRVLACTLRSLRQPRRLPQGRVYLLERSSEGQTIYPILYVAILRNPETFPTESQVLLGTYCLHI
ncbi:hypothetical protein D3C78_1580380 [compost metagenome]